jgi:hypothetical protein
MQPNNQNRPDPRFSADLEYLKRISYIVDVIHNYLGVHNFSGAVGFISELQSELRGRMVKLGMTKEIEEARKLEAATMQMYSETRATNKEQFQAMFTRRWFDYLYGLAHKMNLISTDKSGQDVATDM